MVIKDLELGEYNRDVQNSVVELWNFYFPPTHIIFSSVPLKQKNLNIPGWLMVILEVDYLKLEIIVYSGCCSTTLLWTVHG